MTTRRVVLIGAAIVVTAAVACGYALAGSSGPTTALPLATPSVVPVPPTTAPRPPALATLATSAPTPQPGRVLHDLAPQIRAVAGGAQLVGEVVDADTGDVLWRRGAAQPAPPASTTKLLTAAAALLALGPDDRLTTSTRRTGHTVYLVGGGDPTIVRGPSSYVAPAYPTPANLAALARRTAAALGAQNSVRLALDASAWSGAKSAPGWKPSYVTEGDVAPPSALELDEGRLDPQNPVAPRSQAPAMQAGVAFETLLRHDGVHVAGRPRMGSAAASQPLASITSPTIAQLVQRMLTISDDDLAEALGRAVARHDDRPATFAGAGRAVLARVRSLGVPMQGVVLHDTSGLSHEDRVTPQALIAVLRDAMSVRHPALRPLIEGLPVAGFTGTLADRYLTEPTSRAAGLVRAKTGTLTGVNTLAGTLVDRSGRQLVFAFMAAHVHLPGLTVPDIDRLTSRLAACGCG